MQSICSLAPLDWAYKLLRGSVAVFIALLLLAVAVFLVILLVGVLVSLRCDEHGKWVALCAVAVPKRLFW
jgi:uncharacterized membrane protein